MAGETLESFFAGYARASSSSDPEALAAHYAAGFLAAGPKGSAVFQNDERFIAWLRQLYDFNEKVGMRSLEVVSVRRLAMGDHHALATVEWAATFTKTGEERIRFEISYLLELLEGRPLILAYVSHEDQEEAMKARGLLPNG